MSKNSYMKSVYKILIGIILVLAVALIAVFYIWHKQKADESKISHHMVLTQIEGLGTLQVVKYSIQDVIEYEKVRTFLPNSKTALIVVGEVTGCIDLKKIKEGDIKTFGDSVSVMLPDPEICNVKIDHSRSRVYDIRFGLWQEAKLIDAAYAHAESQIQKEAEKMGIAVDCQENARQVLEPILKALGFRSISIHFKTPFIDKKTEQGSLKIIR